MSGIQWVKTIYYYVVILISLLFFVVGAFNIIRTAYVYNLSPYILSREVKYIIPGDESRCYDNVKYDKDTKETIPADQSICNQQTEKYKRLWLEQNLISSVISVSLATIVAVTHYITIGKYLSKIQTTVTEAKRK